MFYENKKESIKIENLSVSIAFNLHMHYQVEIVYIEKGSCVATVEGKDYVLGSDSLLIVFPNKPHSFESIDEEAYTIAITSPSITKQTAHLFDTKIPLSPIIENVSSYPDLYSAVMLLKESADDNGNTADIVKLGVSVALFGLIFKYLPTENLGAECSPTMRTIIDYCSKNYSKDLSLEVLSRELHMSKYYISHLFGKEFNMKFNDYVNSLRIMAASRLLCDTDKNITKISEEVGFATARTFNRAFSKLHNISPTEYRNFTRKRNNE